MPRLDLICAGPIAVSQLLWPRKGREEWFSLSETAKGDVVSVYSLRRVP